MEHIHYLSHQIKNNERKACNIRLNILLIHLMPSARYASDEMIRFISPRLVLSLLLQRLMVTFLPPTDHPCKLRRSFSKSAFPSNAVADFSRIIVSLHAFPQKLIVASFSLIMIGRVIVEITSKSALYLPLTV